MTSFRIATAKEAVASPPGQGRLTPPLAHAAASSLQVSVFSLPHSIILPSHHSAPAFRSEFRLQAAGGIPGRGAGAGHLRSPYGANAIRHE